MIIYFYALLLYASLVVALGANHAFTLAHYHVVAAPDVGRGSQRHASMHKRQEAATRRRAVSAVASRKSSTPATANTASV